MLTFSADQTRLFRRFGKNIIKEVERYSKKKMDTPMKLLASWAIPKNNKNTLI